MTPEVLAYVSQKTQPTELGDLCTTLKELVKMSRTEMAKNYSKWDYYDQVYRGERAPDAKDLEARKRGEPEKLIIPLTFSQVQTFVSFGYSLYNQRDYFYEFEGGGAEDEKPAQIASAIVEQNLRYNKFRATKVIQHLTDIARFGVGIIKESWVDEQCPVFTEVPDPAYTGQIRTDLTQPGPAPMIRQVTLQTKYKGNKIVNISPYRWFPDTRLPLTRWSEGEFCADEIEESISKLESYARQGLAGGLEHVSTFNSQAFDGRRMTMMQPPAMGMMTKEDPKYMLITEVQVRLNPSVTEIAPGVVLNKDLDYDAIHIVWIANDDRIIRISEAGYNHEQFGYNCAQFLDDQNRLINFSLCDVLAAVQDTATWFLNARITSVRKTIFNQLAIDPSAIELEDIINRSPIIRLKPGRAGSGIDTWMKQLQVNDVTQNHTADVAVLSNMGKEATGINETLLGQFSSGRRSAKEAGNVANAAAGRLVMIFASIWESCYEPHGNKLISNLRQSLDIPTMVRIYGEMNVEEGLQPDLPNKPPPIYRLIPVDKNSLVGNYDLTVFNGTLPSQRASTAGVLKELLTEMLDNPQIVAVTGLDPQKLFFEILTLLNIRNVQRFKLTPERLQALVGMAQAGANARNAGTPQGGGGPAPQANVPVAG